MKRVKRYILAIAFLLVVGVTFGVDKQKDDKNVKFLQNIEILINMFKELNMVYVDEIDSEKMLDEAADGMVKSLDPYTKLIPAREMSDFETMTTGKYGGIGSIIRQDSNYVVIAEPYKDSPADKAGLKIGDKIVELEGKSAKGYKSEDVSSILRGDPGTKVNLKVEKFDTGEVVPVEIKRERIRIPAVPYFGFVSDGIGYICHTDFTAGGSEEVADALKELKATGKLKGLILDYSSNGGGLLNEAVQTLSIFLPKGTEVVSMKGRVAQMSNTYKTESNPLDTELPIVVLTSPSSASAAEIVSGAMQDMDRAVLLGQKTFGKGLVQSTRPLGYNSYLKLTTAKYYIPSGRCIQAIDYAHKNEDGSVGVVPDSLIKEFQTQNGRKVYDGGGVMPDVKVEPEYSSRFAIILYARNYIGQFVDSYMKKNPQSVDLDNFKITDDIYNDFIAFMADKDVEYESESKKALAELREKAKKEKYLDNIAEQLDRIEDGLKDDKQSNLELYKKELMMLIEDDIILRSHYRQGVIKHGLAENNSVKEAVKLLNDPQRYSGILKSQDTARK